MCDCAKVAENLARQSASADFEIARTRAAQEERFHARQRAELASEAIMSLGRALALFSPQGRIVEKSKSILEDEATRISDPLQDLVRKRMKEIRDCAEDLQSQTFASNFVDSGLRLGRARLELKYAEDALRLSLLRLVQPTTISGPQGPLEIRGILENHVQ